MSSCDNPKDKDLTNFPSDSNSDLTAGNFKFGLGICQPKCLQVFANKKFFTFLACCLAFLQTGITQGFIPVVISSIEKRYNFGSTEAGALVAVFDACIAIAVIIVSYLGGKAHKPRLLGIFAIIIAFSSFVFASPQFIFGSYSSYLSINSTSSLCNNTISETDEDCLSINVGAYSVLVLAMIFLAIGSSPIYTVIPAYIDEIVYPRYVSLHLAIFFVCSVIGPAIGFLSGSAFLSIYVDPWSATDLTPTDPTWVGAWWIGHIIFGFLLLLVSIMLFMFPQYLPDSHLVRQERLKEIVKKYSSKYANENNLTIVFKTFPVHIKQLLLNPSFMLMSFGLSIAFIVKDGLFAFGPKYIEIMFSLTATASGLLAGGVAIVGAGIGTVTGGLIIYIFKLKGRQTSSVAWIVLLITIFATFLYFLRCPSPQVAGISVPYADGSSSGKDSSLCAMSCNCITSSYDPVCGADGLTYYSPCEAGCTTEAQNQDFSYKNCTCIAESFANSSYIDSSATSGICNNDCDIYLWIFVVLIGALVVLLLMIEIPYYYSTMRVVADEQRPLALGFQSSIYRTLGSIPGPLLFGVVFDSSCVFFNYECGKRGNCWIYDHHNLSLYAFLLSFPCIVIATLLLFLHWVTFPKRKSDESTLPEKSIQTVEAKL